VRKRGEMEKLLEEYLKKFETWWKSNIEPTVKNFEVPLKEKIERQKEGFKQYLYSAVDSHNALSEKIPSKKKSEFEEDFHCWFNEQLEHFNNLFGVFKRINEFIVK